MAAEWDPRLALVQFSASRTLHEIKVGERRLMFCDRRQKVFEFNATLDAIWSGLTGGMTPQEIVAGFVGQGLDQATAETYVGGPLSQWLRQGDLTPTAVLQALNGAPDQVRGLRIDALRVTLRLFGDLDLAAVDAAFAQFAAAGSGAAISAVGFAGAVHVFDGDIPLGAVPPHEFVPLLKVIFTERFLASSPEGFLAHTALLARAGKGLLLSGQPGAGKSTLCVALGSSGWTLCADDIVRIDPHGVAHGVPFAPAIKTGSWDLLAPYVPALADQPTQLRTDGQWVRYLPMSKDANEAVPIGAVLLLARTPDAEPSLEPIDPLEALTHILDSAYATSHRIDAGTLKALAAALSKATCARLHYSNLERAVAFVSDRLD